MNVVVIIRDWGFECESDIVDVLNFNHSWTMEDHLNWWNENKKGQHLRAHRAELFTVCHM